MFSSTSSAIKISKISCFFSVNILQTTAIPEEKNLRVKCEVVLVPSGNSAGEQVSKLQKIKDPSEHSDDHSEF